MHDALLDQLSHYRTAKAAKDETSERNRRVAVDFDLRAPWDLND
jgi:hypothetical protein